MPQPNDLSRSPVALDQDFKSIGRNDSCPCSSGKKFKKCCLGTVRFESLGPEAALSGASGDWIAH